MDNMIKVKGLGIVVSNIKWTHGIAVDSCKCGGTEISIDLMLISNRIYLSVLAKSRQ